MYNLLILACMYHIHTTASIPSAAEVPLVPGNCFSSKLFLGEINCYTNLRVSFSMDRVGKHYNLFTASKPDFIQYKVFSNKTLNLCLSNNVFDMIGGSTSFAMKIQELCMREASSVCETIHDDRDVIFFGNQGVMHVNTGKKLLVTKGHA